MRIENLMEGEVVDRSSPLTACGMILLRRKKMYSMAAPTGLSLACCAYLSGLSTRTAVRGWILLVNIRWITQLSEM